MSGMFSYLTKYRWVLYLVVAAFVFGGTVALFLRMGVVNITKFATTEEAALHGDSFGFVNALFSGLALGGVVLALLVQVLEFHLAEKERSDGIKTQKQIADQQKDIAEQTKFSARAQMMDSLLVIHSRSKLEILVDETEPYRKCKEQIRQLHFGFEKCVNEQRMASNLRQGLELTTVTQELCHTANISAAQEVIETLEQFDESHSKLAKIVANTVGSKNGRPDIKSKAIAQHTPDVIGLISSIRDLIDQIYSEPPFGHDTAQYLFKLKELENFYLSNNESSMKSIENWGSASILSKCVTVDGMVFAYEILGVRVVFVKKSTEKAGFLMAR